MRLWARLITLMVLLLLVSCKRDSKAAESGYQVPDLGALQSRTFDALRKIVDDKYVYEEMLRGEWETNGERYRARLEEGLDQDEFDALVEEMLGELPPGTVDYQSRQSRIDQAAADDSSYQGIGAFVSVRGLPDPRIVILFVMPDSPAEQAGLKAHDAILAIDGQPVVTGNENNPVARVRGPEGSDVTLTVRSPGEEPREMTVTRGRIEVTQYRLLYDVLGSTKVGYFLFPPSSYENLWQDFILGMRALDAGGDLEAMIIDLRIVSASGDWPLGSLLALFTDGEAGAFHSRSETNPVAVEGFSDFLNSQELPVALIVGPTTTGSAEIFAAVMQSSGKGIVVGGATSGEIESKETFALPDGSRVSVAAVAYRNGNDVEVGLVGVQPDIPVSADWDEVTQLDDPVLQAALRQVIPGSG